MASIKMPNRAKGAIKVAANMTAEQKRDRARKDSHRISHESGDQEAGREPPSCRRPEPGLQPGIGGFLLPLEVAGQKPAGHEQPPDQVPERELEKGEVAPGADAGNRDNREGGGFGGDNGEQHGPCRQIAGAKKIVPRRALGAGNPQPHAQGENEIDDDDGEIDAGNVWAPVNGR